MATDPVCGMHVDEKNAVFRKEKNGETFYFCSEKCLKEFEQPEIEYKNLKRITLFSVVLASVTLVLTYFPALPTLPNNVWLFIFATPVQFIGGWKFYKGAWDASRAKTANMDTLIALGTSAAWLYSTLVIILPQTFKGEAYFDTSAVIIALILVGKLLEEIAKGRASESLRKLMDLRPKTAVVIKNGKEIEIPVDEIGVGDMMLVKPGQSIPTDGVIVEGHTEIDESMITGESLPVSRKENDKVIGSTINKSGLLKIRALNVGADTTLSQIISLVEKAQLSKVPIQRLADKVSAYFVPVVILVAIVSSFVWYAMTADFVFALTVSIMVLIIACPCALGLATPTAILVGTGKAAENGILIRSGEALETAHKINTIVFDKTGTLTKGKPSVTDVIAVNGDEEELLRLAAICEKGSEHPLGEAIIRKADEQSIKTDYAKSYHTVAGKGIKCEYLGKTLAVGNEELMKAEKISATELGVYVEKLQNEGKTAVMAAYNNRPMGVIGIADTLQEYSVEAVGLLRKKGIESIMITGDNERTANAIAKQAGIEKVFAKVLPHNKADKVKELQAEGKIVAFVGDGINDAPALAQADVGIAIGSGTDVAKETGSIILIKHDLRDVFTSIDISGYTIKKIKQNLFWAFFYNVAGIPIAAGLLYPNFGLLLTPMIAAAAMAFSSFFVVGNSVLMKGYRPKI
ncbi:MAG: heavy metal translocating P-type ATPase [Candidatus Aenigmarchaeota archaeon]|nr:heavy metal translocating P-type ATPase [Candidatus Aenigmarchaeota archaeon]